MILIESTTLNLFVRPEPSDSRIIIQSLSVSSINRPDEIDRSIIAKALCLEQSARDASLGVLFESSSAGRILADAKFRRVK